VCTHRGLLRDACTPPTRRLKWDSRGCRATRGRTCFPGATSSPGARGFMVVEAVLPTIGVIAGDGVGPEVVREGLAVLADAASRDGFRYELETFEIGGERYLK